MKRILSFMMMFLVGMSLSLPSNSLLSLTLVSSAQAEDDGDSSDSGSSSSGGGVVIDFSTARLTILINTLNGLYARLAATSDPTEVQAIRDAIRKTIEQIQKLQNQFVQAGADFITNYGEVILVGAGIGLAVTGGLILAGIPEPTSTGAGIAIITTALGGPGLAFGGDGGYGGDTGDYSNMGGGYSDGTGGYGGDTGDYSGGSSGGSGGGSGSGSSGSGSAGGDGSYGDLHYGDDGSIQITVTDGNGNSETGTVTKATDNGDGTVTVEYDTDGDGKSDGSYTGRRAEDDTEVNLDETDCGEGESDCGEGEGDGGSIMWNKECPECWGITVYTFDMEDFVGDTFYISRDEYFSSWAIVQYSGHSYVFTQADGSTQRFKVFEILEGDYSSQAQSALMELMQSSFWNH